MIRRNKKFVLTVALVSLVSLGSPLSAMGKKKTKSNAGIVKQTLVETFTPKVQTNIKNAAAGLGLSENQLSFVIKNAKDIPGKHVSFERLRNAKAFVQEQMGQNNFPAAQGELVKDTVQKEASLKNNQEEKNLHEIEELDWLRNQNIEEVFTKAPNFKKPDQPKKLIHPPVDPDSAGNTSVQEIKAPFFKNPWLYFGAMTAVPVIYALYNIIKLANDPAALRNNEAYLSALINAAKRNNIVVLQEQLKLFQDHMTVIGKEKMSQLREFAQRGQMQDFITLADSCRKEIAEIISPAQKAFSKEAVVKVLKRIKLGFMDEVEAIKIWVAKKAVAAKADKAEVQRA